MPFAEVPGASLYYEIHGAGPWLVFAHGAGGNHLSWWQQVPVFAGRFRCLVFDQRGWGRSRCDDPPDPGHFAADLSALLDHVGAARAALVGQSMGGWTVLGCALRDARRVTHLVLTGTLAGLTDAAITTRLLAVIDQGATQPIDGRAALAADFPEREPVRTFLFEQIAALNPPLTPAFLRALVTLRYTPPPSGPAFPVCFIAGERDRLFPLDLIRHAHAQVSGAALVVVPEAGHSVYFERPREFNHALAAVLGVEI
ncbi:MAG: alpha/beta fold hydrolase [Candidatus Binatia bacterium]